MNPPPEIRIVGYCRVCGTGLDEANVHTANGTIYCQEHLPTVNAPPPPPGAGSQPFTPPFTPYNMPPPPRVGDYSPGTAFVLGLIPGVGAMYNDQMAKGVVHFMILVILIHAADSSYGSGAFFGVMIPLFWIYMAFEAYHTARRKREGLPVDEFSGLSSNHTSRFPLTAVLLIVFGVFFLLDNLGILELSKLLKFWPAAMIALGMYLLYLRTKGSDQ